MSDDLLPLDERIRLVELVDRVLDRGVVLRGDVIISVAGIDLVYLELRLLLAAMETLERSRSDDLADQSSGESD
jgi:gas vesicle structural protein